MKTLVAAMLALAVMPAQAVFIEAKLDSFESTDAVVNGVGPAGGIGSFSLLTDVTGTQVDFLGSRFFAQCLEHDESIAPGGTYRFEVVDLAAAPTSVGGMGALRANWIELVLAGLGFSGMSDVAVASNLEQSAVQMAVYEAVNETGLIFDWDAGAALIGGSGAALSGQVHVAAASATIPLIDSFGLLNIGIVGAPAARSIYRAQDFMVFQERTIDIPEPGPMALMGLGLLGLAGFTRWKQ